MGFVKRLRAGLRWRVAVLLVPLLLAACVFETEAKLRKQLEGTLFLRDTVYYEDHLGCTAALFTLYSRYTKPRVMRAGDLTGALYLIDRGRTVAFDMGLSPNELSKEIRVLEHPVSFGINSAGVTGALHCLTKDLQTPLYQAMTDPEVVTVYDPEAHTLSLVDWREKRAWVLRGYD